LVGAELVVRFLKDVRERFQGKRTLQFAHVNGQPAAIEYHDGQIFCLSTFDFKAGRISAIYSLLNPDKLHGFSEAT
jgi:hypothetical protein